VRLLNKCAGVRALHWYATRMLPFRASLFTLILSLPPLLGAVESRPLLDKLPQNSIQSAFQILRRDYIRREDLSYEELNRAALQGLLERLDFGAELVPAKSEEKAVAPYVHAEFLAPDVAYLRPETFAQGEGELFEKALKGTLEKKAKHLILDLRAGGKGLFEEAADVLQTFLPSGELMFKLKQLHSDDAELFISKSAPIWTERVVVLIDGETGPAAEAVAAVLHGQGRALLIGEKTRGATVRYSDVGLDENTILRYASAEMLLPDGTSRFKVGLEPMFKIVGSQKEKRLAFEGSRGKSHLQYVNDRVRPRFNERALVHDQHPELDDYVRRSKGQSLPGDEGQTRDVVTQRAIDFILAGDFGGASKIDWEPKSNPAEGPVENIPKAVPANPTLTNPEP
jgi:hypothetical protein